MPEIQDRITTPWEPPPPGEEVGHLPDPPGQLCTRYGATTVGGGTGEDPRYGRGSQAGTGWLRHG